MVQLALFVAALFSLLLGVFILLNNPRSSLFRWYFCFGLASSIWILVNALSTQDIVVLHETALLYVSRLITPFSLFSALFFFYFLKDYTSDRVEPKHVVLAVPSLIVSSFSFSSLNVYLSDSQVLVLGQLFIPYVIVLLFNVSLIFYTLFTGSKYKKFKDPVLNRQLNHMKMATLVTLIPLILLGTLLPLFSNSSLSNLAPLFSICFLSIAAYSMARHRLFDLRITVARSLAYIVALVIFASIYGFLMFAIISLLFGVKLPIYVQVLLSAATGFAALLFHRFKMFFDTKTSRIFYQDAYSTEQLYAEYNKTLVSTIDLDTLLKRTTQVINKYIRSNYCLIGVKDGDLARYRIVGTADIEFNASDIEVVRAITPRIHHAVILVDTLPPEQIHLKEMLQKCDIAVLVRLASDFHHIQEGLGYMALGHKKSGNPYTGQDVRVLETLANELIIALQNALRFEEIERFNETLQQRINDATRQLRQSNKKLKQLNDSKDDFIGMASHQLRTPLTSVKGYVSLVMDGDAGKVTATQRKLLLQAFSSAQKMVNLVADLLNVSRLKTGKFAIERKPTNLAAMIKEEMSQLREEAKSRGLELTFHAPDNFPVLPLDDTKTRQVIMNFLDNAIYYTPSGGHIRAELKELPKSIEFRVVDDGIGVPKAEHHHLFTKFYRAKNAQRARPDGTGLGLYMAQKVVMAQGGATIFNSVEGKGSTFGFVFPKDMSSEPVMLPIQTRD